jgi:hypothetical protein
MIDLLTSWTGWLVGGSMLTLVAVAALAYAVGAQKAVELVVSVLQPIFTAVGNAAGNAITVTYENTRDGLLYIGRSGKAIFALLVICGLVAGATYVPATKKAERKTWEKVRRDYTLVNKRKKAPEQSPGVKAWKPTPFGYGVK